MIRQNLVELVDGGLKEQSLTVENREVAVIDGVVEYSSLPYLQICRLLPATCYSQS